MPCRPVAEQRQGFVVAGRDGITSASSSKAIAKARSSSLRNDASCGASRACACRSAQRSFDPNGDSRAGWPLVQTRRGRPSSLSQRLSSPQTCRYDSDISRAAAEIEPLRCTASRSSSSGWCSSARRRLAGRQRVGEIDPMHESSYRPASRRHPESLPMKDSVMSAVPESFATAFASLSMPIRRWSAPWRCRSRSAAARACARQGSGSAGGRLARGRALSRPARRPARCSTRCSRLPSVVVGLAVYLLLSRSGPLGSWGILFTPAAMVIAQTILVAADRSLRSRARSSPTRCAKAATSCARWAPARSRRALLLLVHERWAVVTLLLIAFGRAIAEVGAVMIVGGNIDGVTRVMTTAIALETSKGDLPLALALGLVLLAWSGCSTCDRLIRTAAAAAGAGGSMNAPRVDRCSSCAARRSLRRRPRGSRRDARVDAGDVVASSAPTAPAFLGRSALPLRVRGMLGFPVEGRLSHPESLRGLPGQVWTRRREGTESACPGRFLLPVIGDVRLRNPGIQSGFAKLPLAKRPGEKSAGIGAFFEVNDERALQGELLKNHRLAWNPFRTGFGLRAAGVWNPVSWSIIALAQRRGVERLWPCAQKRNQRASASRRRQGTLQSIATFRNRFAVDLPNGYNGHAW